MKHNFTEIIDRIEQARELLGLNKSQFCKAFDMRPQTYSNFIGKQGSKPSVELIVGVAEAYEVNLNWVLLGKGPMFGPPPPR